MIVREAMIDYNISLDYSHLNGVFLVFCPEFSPSQYEVCSVEKGIFTSQANGDVINDYVNEFIALD